MPLFLSRHACRSNLVWRRWHAFTLSFLATLALGGMPGKADSLKIGDPLPIGPITLGGDGPNYLDLGAGVYDLIGNSHRNETGAAEAEFRYGRKLYGIGPAAGIIGDFRGGGMVFTGLYSDFSLGRIVLTPLAGVGAWWQGGSNDENLGGTFEFRLQLEASYQFDNDMRLGLRFGHISNANTNNINPGENDLMLTYGLPLTF
jgi:lipid A 3-O-deacylase